MSDVPWNEAKTVTLEGDPPTMLMFNRRLSEQAKENIRMQWQSAMTGPHKLIVVEDCWGLYQMIDGQWRRL